MIREGRKSAPAKRPKNTAEAACWNDLVRRGFEPTKRGWPDFIAWDGHDFRVVEVKPKSTSKVKQTQLRIMRALAKCGVQCFVWSPDGGYVQVERE